MVKQTRLDSILIVALSGLLLGTTLIKGIQTYYSHKEQRQQQELQQQIDSQLVNFNGTTMPRSEVCRLWRQNEDHTILDDDGVPKQTNTLETIAATNPVQKIDQNVPGRVNNLISNEFFRDSTYLTAQEIKDLLTKYNSCLVGHDVEDQIIEASKKHDINPLLLLARLQTEKGLVTKTKANTSDLKYATGFGCYDSGRKLRSAGLRSQIENAAKLLDQKYDEFKPGITVPINNGSKRVIPQNAATYACLRYTPHEEGSQLNVTIARQYAKHIKLGQKS